VFVVRLGLTLEVIAMIGIAWTYSADASQGQFVPWLLLFGAGVGLGTAQLINVILRDVPVTQSGQASGTQSTSRQVGVSLGVAILGAVLWSTLSTVLPSNLESQAGVSAAEAQAITDEVVASSGVTINSGDVPAEQSLAGRYGPEVAEAAADAFATATAVSTLVGAAFVGIGVLGTVLGFRRRTDDDGRADRRATEAGSAVDDEGPTLPEPSR
jgi:hypothetical protein